MKNTNIYAGYRFPPQIISHKGRLNDFYRVTVLSITCLDLADIIRKPVITEYSVNELLLSGAGLVVSRIWHKLLKSDSNILNSIS
jgi:hypothetical protein